MNGSVGIGKALLPLCSSSSSILRLCALLMLLSLLHQSAVAYSSVYECGDIADDEDVYNAKHPCENVGEDQMGINDYSKQCPPPAHLVLELKERNDALARHYAEHNGMILKGPTFISGTSQPFLDTFYFLSSSSVFNSSFIKQLVGRMVCKPGVESLIFNRPQIRVKRDFITSSQPHNLVGSLAEEGTLEQTTFFEQREVPKLPFRDPLYEEQWYLIRGAEGGEFDMNVREAWMMGYAGRNVTISILDDGIQWDHPDLVSNYDPLASFDFIGNDTDPTPRVYDNHGTHCAGIAAAVARNSVCGVGVAFLAKIGGIRMKLDGPMSDSVEADSMNLNHQRIDIYSASCWGPADDGETFEGPHKLAKEAFYRGIKSRRGGRGNIFVWASGNGRMEAFDSSPIGWQFVRKNWRTKRQSKRDGNNVSHFLNTNSTYSKGANTRIFSYLALERFHKAIAKQIDSKSNKNGAETVIRRLEEVRQKVLACPRNVHFAGDPERVRMAEETTKQWEFLATENSAKFLKCPADYGSDWSLMGKSRTIAVGGSESAFLLQKTPFEGDWTLPSTMHTLLLSQYLIQCEGPLWNAIPGTGLAYDAAIYLLPDRKALTMELYRCSQLALTFEKTRDTLLSILDSAQLDPNLLDAAKRSLVCELIAGQSTVKSIAMSALLATIRGVDLDFTLKLCSRIWNANAEEVLGKGAPAIRQLFDPDRSVRSIALNPSRLSEVKERFPGTKVLKLEELQIAAPKF